MAQTERAQTEEPLSGTTEVDLIATKLPAERDRPNTGKFYVYRNSTGSFQHTKHVALIPMKKPNLVVVLCYRQHGPSPTGRDEQRKKTRAALLIWMAYYISVGSLVCGIQCGC